MKLPHVTRVSLSIIMLSLFDERSISKLFLVSLKYSSLRQLTTDTDIYAAALTVKLFATHACVDNIMVLSILLLSSTDKILHGLKFTKKHVSIVKSARQSKFTWNDLCVRDDARTGADARRVMATESRDRARIVCDFIITFTNYTNNTVTYLIMHQTQKSRKI